MCIRDFVLVRIGGAGVIGTSLDEEVHIEHRREDGKDIQWG
jgi:hypothetical protein